MNKQVTGIIIWFTYEKSCKSNIDLQGIIKTTEQSLRKNCQKHKYIVREIYADFIMNILKWPRGLSECLTWNEKQEDLSRSIVSHKWVDRLRVI